MAETVTITIPKLPDLLRLLRGSDLYREPWKRALESIGVVTEQIAISRAPLRTGATIARLTHKVSARDVPMYVVVKTTARNPRNRYLYPRLIEYSRRSPRKGWFRSAFYSARSTFDGILDRAAGQIEDIWKRSF